MWALFSAGRCPPLPADCFLLTDLQEHSELFVEELVVVGQVVAEEGEGFGESAAAGDDFGPTVGEVVEGGVLLIHAHRVLAGQDGDAAGQADPFSRRGHGGQDHLGGRK